MALYPASSSLTERSMFCQFLFKSGLRRIEARFFLPLVMSVQKRSDEDHDPFETVIDQVKRSARAEKDTDLSVEAPETNTAPSPSIRPFRHQKLSRMLATRFFPSASIQNSKIGSRRCHLAQARLDRRKGIPLFHRPLLLVAAKALPLLGVFATGGIFG